MQSQGLDNEDHENNDTKCKLDRVDKHDNKHKF